MSSFFLLFTIFGWSFFFFFLHVRNCNSAVSELRACIQWLVEEGGTKQKNLIFCIALIICQKLFINLTFHLGHCGLFRHIPLMCTYFQFDRFSITDPAPVSMKSLRWWFEAHVTIIHRLFAWTLKLGTISHNNSSLLWEFKLRRTWSSC